jgi:hypothetical protein
MAVKVEFIDYFNVDDKKVIFETFVSGLSITTNLVLDREGGNRNNASTENIWSATGTEDRTVKITVPETVFSINGVIRFTVIGTDGSYGVDLATYQLKKVDDYVRDEDRNDPSDYIKNLSPNDPKNLAVDSVGDGTVTLVWNHNFKDDRDRQELYVDLAHDQDLGSKDESVQKTGLTNGQSYLFFVTGVNASVDPAIYKASNFVKATPVDSVFPSSQLASGSLTYGGGGIAIGHNDNLFVGDSSGVGISEMDRSLTEQATHTATVANSSIRGIAYNADTGYYYTVDNGNNIDVHDTNFNHVSDEGDPFPSENCEDIEYWNSRYWVVGSFNQVIYELDSTFSIVSQYDVSGYMNGPKGLWRRTDRDIWIIGGDNDVLYSADDSFNKLDSQNIGSLVGNTDSPQHISHEGDFWWVCNNNQTAVYKLD